MDEFLSRHPGTEVRTERRILGPELRLSASALADLKARGYQHSIVPIDTEDEGDTVNRPRNSTELVSLFGFQQHVDTLNALAARYPALTRNLVVGYSAQGRPIHAFKVSDNPAADEDEPTILVVATHHAWEGIGLDIALEFLDRLLTGYGQDPAMTSYVNDNEIWVVPLLNPDGWMLLENQVVSWWRKNAHDNNGDQMFDTFDGVDINRNYGVHWELGTANPSSPLYRGSTPFSEPETAILRDLVLATKPTLALSYHQSGEVIIIPWTWNGASPPDSVTYRSIASGLAGSIAKLNGAPYAWFQANDTAGYMDDWMYGETGAFCFTVEVSADNSQIPSAVENNLAGLSYALDRLSGPQVTGCVTSLATGAPLQAELDLQEIDTSTLGNRFSDPATGRYRRLLVPGSYTLRVHAMGYTDQSIPFTVVPDGPTVVNVAMVGAALAVESGTVPQEFHLRSHPNPMRGAASIRFFLSGEGVARLGVYDLSGRLIRSLLDGDGQHGWTTVSWDGRDDAGREAPAGAYVLRLSQRGQVESRRVVMLR